MRTPILFILLSVSITSFAQNKNLDWVFVGSDGGGSKWFIKFSDNNTKQVNVNTFWYKDVNEVIDSLTNIQPLFLVEVNCRLNTMKLLKSSVVSLTGKVIFDQTHKEPAEKVIPGSMKELVLQKACEIFSK